MSYRNFGAAPSALKTSNSNNEAGRAGFVFCGMTVAETSFGGREVVSILRRQVSKKLR
jgi:hypothetical protein